MEEGRRSKSKLNETKSPKNSTLNLIIKLLKEGKVVLENDGI